MHMLVTVCKLNDKNLNGHELLSSNNGYVSKNISIIRIVK